jgi:predicted Zn finger-like uncharacterized protein
MKITCHACDAKYTIADEKVTGRTVKIKCKKCGATIVVNADPAAAAAPAAPAYHDPQQHAGGDEDGLMATRMANEGGGVPGVTAAEWTVSVNDQERQMSQLQIAEEMQRGTVTGDTYVWRDGMSDWLSVAQVPELAALLARAGGGHAPAPAPVQDEPNMGLAGTIVMSDAPVISPLAAAPRPAAGMPAPAAATPSPAFAAPAPAARRANRTGGSVDIFQANAETREATDRPRPPTPAGRLGERNENSVLFSLSALTATENAAAKGRPDDAVLDLGIGGRSNGKKSAVDDLMNIGGGAIGGPMLAPPPLLAPVVEPPPAPAPVAVPVAAAMPGTMPSTMPGAPAQAQFVIPAPPPKSKAPLIVGGVFGVLLIGGLVAFFAASGPPPPELTPSSTPTAAVTSAPSPSVTASEAPTATEAPSASSGAPAASSAVVASNDSKTPSTGSGGGVGTGPKPKESSSPTPSATASAKASAEPAPQPTASATASGGDSGGAGRDFNKGAATAALAAAAGAAKGCKSQANGTTGSASVRVVFAPSGNVTSATVNGPPFAGTPAGSCIAAAFKGAHVPPFDGSPVAVSKTVNIN